MHPLVTGHGMLPDLPRLLADLDLRGTAFVVTDDCVLALLGDRVRDSLERAGWRVRVHAVPQGEGSKSIACASELWDWLVRERAERRDVLIALGGGVVGDLAGFVAATYLRGIPLVQAPTNLLAQVDSAIGGKNGVNHPAAKNLIGAVYPPALTLADTSLLATLPEAQVRSGWAEVVKTALISDPDLFRYLMDHAQELRRLEPEPLAHVVGACARFKLEVVTKDPRERGRRAILNYGHTVGHAVEAAAGYGALSHGECVAIGMRAAATIGVELGVTPPEVAERQAEALRLYGLPRSAAGVELDDVLERMTFDKKVRAGGIRWVLLRGIGRTELVDGVPPDVVRRAVAGCLS